MRKVVVALVTVVTLLLGVLLVLVAVFGPILGLIPEPAPVAKDVYVQTQERVDQVKGKVETVQQGLEALEELQAVSESLQGDEQNDKPTAEVSTEFGQEGEDIHRSSGEQPKQRGEQ